tara:strand:- start:774 stop:1037 length:264 start_codon:yes stop_codon:yes gene_type:complete
MATCPECEADVDVDDFDVDRGDTLSCQDCGRMLEVISLSPIELDLVPEEDDEDGDDGVRRTSGQADGDEGEEEEDDDDEGDDRAWHR